MLSGIGGVGHPLQEISFLVAMISNLESQQHNGDCSATSIAHWFDYQSRVCYQRQLYMILSRHTVGVVTMIK